MSRRIAITRAEPEARVTAERVRERGGVPIIAPLLTIEPRPFDANLGSAQALLFTSINGVVAFAGATAIRDVAVITVGNATADAAMKAGFRNVRTANGDVGALAEVAGKVLDPKGGKVIHVSGMHTAGDLVGALRRAGFEAEHRIAFEAVQAKQLPNVLVTEDIDVMLFHSARAAEAYFLERSPRAAERIAVCLGPRIAEVAQKILWKRLIVAPAPREDAILDAAFAA